MNLGAMAFTALITTVVAIGCGGSDSGDDDDTGSGGATSSSGGSSSSSSSGGGSDRAAVQIILNRACTGCHAGSDPAGGRSWSNVADSIDDDSNLVDGAKVIVPGNAADSLMVQVLKGPVGRVGKMPEGRSLPADDITTIETWIDDGARTD